MTGTAWLVCFMVYQVGRARFGWSDREIKKTIFVNANLQTWITLDIVALAPIYFGVHA